MAENWIHTYRPTKIAVAGTITAQHPGRDIAKAVTEIQEKCITSMTSEVDGISAEIESNNVTITGAGVPSGGTLYQVLQRDSDGSAVWDYVRAV